MKFVLALMTLTTPLAAQEAGVSAQPFGATVHDQPAEQVLTLEELLTFVADLREAAAQSWARGEAGVSTSTIHRLLPASTSAPSGRSVPARIEGRRPPRLSQLETRLIVAQVRARAKEIRAIQDAHGAFPGHSALAFAGLSNPVCSLLAAMERQGATLEQPSLHGSTDGARLP